MVNKKVIIAVDRNFFDNVFENQRKKRQFELGILNLSQTNFTKMIKGFKLKVPKQKIIKNKIKRGKKINVSFEF